jgi:hypothetical protein
MAPPCTIVKPHWQAKRANWQARALPASPLPLGKSSDYNCSRYTVVYACYVCL